ncbi:MAG: hypothetical protein LBV00_01285 [Propionibacteriaceae bacterium]|jgi:two-component system sensor histidine kinase SenX3|nr:hypothetical protein [Propionibacteriaceae bacterium]
MATSRGHAHLAALPDHVIATAQALGGLTVIVTDQHDIVYRATLMADWGFTDTDRLTQPDLVAAADQAWASGEHIVRPCHIETATGVHDVVVDAGAIDRRWVLLHVTDRTEEIQAIQIRRDFVSNIGHELRTPVTSVGLIASALRSCADDAAAVRHFADRLERVSYHLGHLTETMLDLARVEGRPADATRDRVPLRDVIDRAIGLWTESAQDRGITLRVKNKVDVAVFGDENGLVTALDNLIGNAVHYSAPGSRVVVAVRVDRAEGNVAIHVIDQGIGIPEHDRDRVFERFYRTDEARSRRAGGTGLGLAIVKHIALSHGGTVTVESQMDAGSTFTVTLPIMVEDSPDSQTSPTAERPRIDRSDTGKEGTP